MNAYFCCFFGGKCLVLFPLKVPARSSEEYLSPTLPQSILFFHCFPSIDPVYFILKIINAHLIGLIEVLKEAEGSIHMDDINFSMSYRLLFA